MTTDVDVTRTCVTATLLKPLAESMEDTVDTKIAVARSSKLLLGFQFVMVMVVRHSPATGADTLPWLLLSRDAGGMLMSWQGRRAVGEICLERVYV